MPSRKIPLISGEIYHVFNRSVAKQPIFNTKRDYNRFLEAIRYFQFLDNPIRFSHFFRMSNDDKLKQTDLLRKNHKKGISVLAFCIMPNHFHFVIKQLEDNAIMSYVRSIQNSYAKYFNIKYKRTGTLFQEQFKAAYIEDNDQLLHICRYTHLNPTTAYLLRDFDELKEYPWTSLTDYLQNNKREIIDTSLILGLFSNNKNKFLDFHLDQMDYQRRLWRVKHLLFE